GGEPSRTPRPRRRPRPRRPADRQADKETRRQGDKETETAESGSNREPLLLAPYRLFSSSPCRLVALSPCRLVALSPCRLVSKLALIPKQLRVCQRPQEIQVVHVLVQALVLHQPQVAEEKFVEFGFCDGRCLPSCHPTADGVGAHRRQHEGGGPANAEGPGPP